MGNGNDKCPITWYGTCLKPAPSREHRCKFNDPMHFGWHICLCGDVDPG